MMEKGFKEFYIDYRFIVKAKTREEAIDLVDEFLPDNDKAPDLWYTIDSVQESYRFRSSTPTTKEEETI